MNKPPVEGQELIQHYDEVSVNPELFRGKSVLILGRGKAPKSKYASILTFFRVRRNAKRRKSLALTSRAVRCLATMRVA